MPPPVALRCVPRAGTDGQATLGDAWWLDLEHITQQQPDLISLSDLADGGGSQPMPDVTAAPPLPLPPAMQKQQQAQQQQGSPAAAAGGGERPPSAQSPSGLAAEQQQQQQGVVGSSGALTGGLAYLQQSLPGALSSGVTSALGALRGRLGLPAAGASSASLATAQQAAAISEEHDEGLLQLGERVLAAGSGGGPSSGAPTTRQLIGAARQFLATCSAEQLRLGDLPVLMADYRRLARLGWSMVLRWAG